MEMSQLEYSDCTKVKAFTQPHIYVSAMASAQVKLSVNICHISQIPKEGKGRISSLLLWFTVRSRNCDRTHSAN